jgi:hypothetical protein
MDQLNDLFSLLAEEKKKKKDFEDRIKTAAKKDFNEVFMQLSPHSKPKEIVEEVLIEATPLPTPIGEVPAPRQNSVIDNLPEIDKWLKSPQVSVPNTSENDVSMINKKIKFLEQWIGKIQNAGPGGGEVNLRYLDDIDRSTISNGLYLRYNSTKNKFEFAAIEDIDNPAQIQSDWDQTDNTKADYIKNKPVDYLTAEVDTLDSVTDRGNTTTNEITVAALNIPVGSVISGDSEIIANITNATLNAVLEHGNSAALSIGDYGLTNGITGVPYTVYELKEVPSPALQVDDIIGGAAIPVLSKIVFVGTGAYNKIIITNKNFALGATLPPENTVITFAREIVNAGLAISTDPNTDVTLNPGAGGHIVPHSDIIPYTTNVWSLGTPGKRFKELWLGTGTIYVEDETLGNDQALGAKNGNFYIQGGAGLEVGEFILRDNTLQIKDSTRDVYIGQIGATADVVFNRSIKVQNSSDRTAFKTDRTGRTQFYPPSIPAGDIGGVSIIGSADGAYQPVVNTGGMLHITGNNNAVSRITNDAWGTNSFPAYISRAGRGTAASPSAILAGDILSRYSTAGWGTTNFAGATVPAATNIEVHAKENFTDTASGTEYRIYTAPIGSTAKTLDLTIDTSGLSFKNTSDATGITFNDNSRLTYFPPQDNKAEKFLKVTNVGGNYVMSWESTPVVVGAVIYKGLYVVSTNSPPITDATGEAGWQYTVSGSGTVNFGIGNLEVQDSDLLIHNGTHYDLIPGPRTQVNSDWNATTGVSAILNKPSFKTVNNNSILGTGNIAVGTVTSVSGAGSVSGLTLTGTVTSIGNLTLGGSIDKISTSVFGIGKVDGTTIAATNGVISSLITQGITSILPTTLDSTHHVAATTVGTTATLICDATTANTPNTIVLRDNNGNINVSSWSVNTHLTAVNYAVSATDYWIGFTAKDKTLTLPATANTGRQYYIADTVHSGNPQITITAAAGATVSGNTSLTQQGQSVIATFINGVWYCN